MGISTITPKKYGELPEKTKQDMDNLAKQLRQYKDNPFKMKTVLFSQLTYMYNLGISAAIEGSIVVEEGRCINIDKGVGYEIVCPYCGEKFDINLEGMLQQDAEGDFAVKL